MSAPANPPVRWIDAAAAADVAEDEMIAVEVAGKPIALYHVGAAFYATDNVCTHAYALLTDGFLDDCTVECPLHAGRFDIATGKALGAPVIQDLATYPVKIADGRILVGLQA